MIRPADHRVLVAAADAADLECRVVLEREGSVRPNSPAATTSSAGWFSERGVRLRTIESEDGRARVALESPRSANVRSIVEALEDRYRGTVVISFRQREREGETRQEFAAHLERDLTEPVRRAAAGVPVRLLRVGPARRRARISPSRWASPGRRSTNTSERPERSCVGRSSETLSLRADTAGLNARLNRL